MTDHSFLRRLGYVPYQMWKETDPRVAFLLQSSLQNFRHELLLENVVGVPILMQHGSADDNVPAFHSRRMHHLISQSENTTPADYIELASKEHWFDGIMCTPPLKVFYADVLNDMTGPDVPLNFTMVVANPSGMGSRGGISVDQTADPNQLGRIEVTRKSSRTIWSLKTSNIRRFHFTETKSVTLPLDLTIDHECFKESDLQSIRNCWFSQGEDGVWQVRDMLCIVDGCLLK